MQLLCSETTCKLNILYVQPFFECNTLLVELFIGIRNSKWVSQNVEITNQ